MRVGKTEKTRSVQSLQQIRRLKGEYRDLLSPTEEFLARKRRELELEKRRC